MQGECSPHTKQIIRDHMINYLISEAIGDIAGSAYEGKSRRIKEYDKVSKRKGFVQIKLK